jgi:hypothetical protein
VEEEKWNRGCDSCGSRCFSPGNRAKREQPCERDSDSCHLNLDFLYSCTTRSRRLKPFMLLNLVKKEKEEGRSGKHFVGVARDDASGC